MKSGEKKKKNQRKGTRKMEKKKVNVKDRIMLNEWNFSQINDSEC